MYKKIDGKMLREMFLSGLNSIANNCEIINGLNVFPVPDGDTGSNLLLTCQSGWDDLKNNETNNIGIIGKKFARGLLMGARGNSGVIFSQIFKGFSEGVINKETATCQDIIQAFNKAKEFAYNSVIKPVEGTILTVIRKISEKLKKVASSYTSIEKIFEVVVKTAKQAVLETPNELPILKEVGVVDSGGRGLEVFLEGMQRAIDGKSVLRKKSANGNDSISFFDGTEVFTGELGYCTEFIIEIKNQNNFKITKFKKGIEKLGSSLIVIRDENILKIHIHTKKPGEVLNFGQKFGEFLKIKSENMTIQANKSSKVKKEEKQKVEDNNKDKKTTDKKNFAIISVNSGNGIIKEMKEMGVSFIIYGGQTANPSAADFINSIDNVDAKNILILPNNKNVILAAQQAVQTVKNKKVIVIPTKSQMHGIAAMTYFSQENSLKDNLEEMQNAIQEVKTGKVALANRDTKIKGVSVKKGEYIAIAEEKIIKSTNSKLKAAIAACENLIDEESEIVTVFYGEESNSVDAEEIGSYIETKYANVEVEIKNGEQPIYDFLILVE